MVEELAGPSLEWICRKFCPITVTRNRHVVEIAGKYHMLVMELIDAVVAAKIDAPERSPLVLR